MARFVGLDVSQKLTSICVVDDAGRRLWRGQCHSEPTCCACCPTIAQSGSRSLSTISVAFIARSCPRSSSARRTDPANGVGRLWAVSYNKRTGRPLPDRAWN
jgi:hypothetical protein